MCRNQIDTTSPWLTNATTRAYPSLDDDLGVDVVVVGGGIAGVTAAYLLKQAGRRVALLERSRCGWGETGRSSAHVTAVTDMRLSTLVGRLGPALAHAVWDAGFSAIARIRATVRDERINCDFAWVPGYLHAASGAPLEEARDVMRREAAVADALGIAATYLDEVPGMSRPGVLFDNQARLHPLKYLEVLLERIHGDGSFVFEGTELTAIEDAPLTAWAGRHRVRADYLVFATHVPVVRDAWLPSEIGTRMSYVVRGIVAPGTAPEALYWEDVEDAYDYLRVDSRDQHDEVIFGGSDGATGERDEAGVFAALESRLASRVPAVSITHRWNGSIVTSMDGLPYIGEVGPRRFAATAFGGNGMTFGTLAGMMAADAAVGRTNPWRALFDIRRTNLPVSAWTLPQTTYRLAGQASGFSASPAGDVAG